jgi:iron complex outermembrane receptor protein
MTYPTRICGSSHLSASVILRAAFAALFALGLLLAPAAAAEAVKKDFNLPAGEAVATLKQFIAQSGEQLLFSSDDVAGLQTKSVSGSMTAREALEIMMSGSKLVVTQDKDTGALALKGPASPNASGAAQSGDRPGKTTERIDTEPVVLAEVEVTGSRVRGLLAGATAQPVLSLSALDIENTGAQSLADVFRYIPQVSSFTLGQQLNAPRVTRLVDGSTGQTIGFASSFDGMSGSAGRVSASLRGTAGDGTLLLVDGRRVPKNNQSSGGDGYDLNGIPLAAIERIEVLLDGASAVYGADAMGGVINVILKKNYRGTEVRLGYDNTFDKDAGVLTGSLTHGFAKGKLRGMVTLNWETSNAMALRDRVFTASYDRRPYGGGDLRFNIPGASGRVQRTGTVPLPGLTSTSAAIPLGTAGTGLTVADYLNAGPIADRLDLAQYQDYSSTFERRGLVASLNYEFARWFEVYSEVRLAENKNWTAVQPIQASNISIPAGYPGNPFGIAILLSKYFFNLQPVREAINDTESVVFGARGFLPGDWRYDAYVSRVDGHTRSESDSGTAITTASLNAAIAAGQQPNLFYDSSSRANPNAPGVIESLTSITTDEEKTETWTYQAHADGPVFQLPAGPIVTAVGAERREEYTKFPRRLATDNFTARPGSREVTGIFAEFNVPIFSPEQALPLMNALNLSGAFRREEYTDGGSTENPRGGIAWRPVSWLQLRGSYGEGFKVPTLSQRTAPLVTANNTRLPVSQRADPMRGGEIMSQTMTLVSGGNPSLRPEQSENTTAGLVLEVPRFKGLSFSFDYFDNKFIDRVGTIAFQERALLFPETVTRGPKLPTDPGSWLGPVTAVDIRAINVSLSRVTGYDVGARYNDRTPMGDLQVSLVGTTYTRNEFAPFTGATTAATVNTESLPLQISGSAFLTQGPWGVGALASYRAHSRPFITATAKTPSAIRWDWQGNYDFEKAEWFKSRRDTWLGWALRDTKVSLTIFNVFDVEPPFDFNYLPDNTLVDSRLRRYALSVRRSF